MQTHLLNYGLFRNKFTIRALGSLMSPPTNPVIHLNIPLNSIYHYQSYDKTVNGPPADLPIFNFITRPIQVIHKTTIETNFGNPVIQTLQTSKLIRDYHLKYKRTRLCKDIHRASGDQNTLIVFNYAMIPMHYRYTKSAFANHNSWMNTFSEVMNGINEGATLKNREQYITVVVPKLIPSVTQLNKASDELTSALLTTVFKTPESYTLLELWKWIKDPSTSLFGNIKKENYHTVNMVITDNSSWTVLNLGTLYSFVLRGKDDEIIEPTSDIVISKSHLNFAQVQKRLLRLFMYINEYKTVVNPNLGEPNEKSNEADRQIQNDDGNHVDDNDSDNIDGNVSDGNSTKPTVTKPENQVTDVFNHTLDKDATQEEIAKHIEIEDSILDSDLAALEEVMYTIENAKDTETHVPNVADIISFNNQIPEKPVQDICDKLSSTGVITPKEHKRFVDLASSYKNIEINGKSVSSHLTITKEELSLPPKIQVSPDSAASIDKSMLNARVHELDSHYIKHVMQKDIVSNIMAVQNAGIAVTDIKVEHSSNILGETQEIEMKVSPVLGSSSTIRMKIPKIEESGIFKANGVKYLLKKQQKDIPIRKIDFNKVILTTYYSKIFITRSYKKSNDYGEWCRNSVMAMAIDNSNTKITNYIINNVFDKTATYSRTYSALSSKFKSFTCNGYDIYFSRKDIVAAVDKVVLSNLEGTNEHDKLMVIGVGKRGYLLLDKNDNVYTAINGKVELFGTLLDFLGLDMAEAPVEYVSVDVLNENIPLGFLLAYYYGLTNLLKIIKAEYRTVAGNSRLNLAKDEYSIRFNDESLIFNKNDIYVSLIVGGFRAYHKQIKEYPIHTFDKQVVYNTLLQGLGLTNRWVREFDLLDQMYVDPQSKSVLEELKEPTTFRGLLFRSVELLLTNNHKDKLATSEMMIKGYERVPGLIYNELVKAIRLQQSSPLRKQKQVTMSPYTIWTGLTSDTSKILIEEINPLKELRESESLTFKGTGGRSGRTMPEADRAYHNDSVGVVSEATKDSGDVGIDTYISPNANIINVRGLTSRHTDDKNVSSLLSTVALLCPGSTND